MIPNQPEQVPFGRYRLVSLLGEGGMAKVYRAVRSGPMGFEKEVALKRIDSRVTRDERVVRALINEARLGGQLRHGNIVEVYEFDEVGGSYFLAMEFIDGWTIDELLRFCEKHGETVPPAVILNIVEQICDGLDYAHNLVSKEGQPLNLVHRDLKPGNLIVSRDGRVKVMDFGIAKADTNLYKTTAADATKGTPMYMSPEQITGDPLDRRSDLFSMGAIIHELVILKPPFRAGNLLGVMHAIVNVDPAAIADSVAAQVPELGPVVARCLDPSPEARYESAAALREALAACRPGIGEAPSLVDWLSERELRLPEPVSSGDFGPDGAPRALEQARSQGTVSLLQVGEAAAPRAPAGYDADADGSSGTMFVRPPGATSLPGTPRPPTGSLPELDRSTTEPRPRSPKFQVFMLFLSFVVLAVVLVRVLSPESEDEMVAGTPEAAGALPGDGSAADGEIPPDRPGEAPVLSSANTADAGAVLAPAETASGSAGPEKPPADSSPAGASDQVRERARAAQEQARQDRKKARAVAAAKEALSDRTTGVTKPPRAGTASAEQGKPATAKGARGLIRLGSKPWARAYVDGKLIGETPITDHSLPVGEYVVLLQCGPCDPPQSKKGKVQIQEGQKTKFTASFRTGRDPREEQD